MSISDVIKTDVPKVSEDSWLSEILKALEKSRAVFVVDGSGKYKGLITEAIAYRPSIDVTSAKVKSVLYRAPALSSSDSTRKAARLMVESGVKVLPVVDDGGGLIGGVYADDVLALFIKELKGIKVEDAAVKDPVTVPETATVGQALSTMRRENVQRLIIVDYRGRLRGIFTLHDVIEKLIKPKYRQKRDSQLSEYKDPLSAKISWLMTRDVKSIQAEKSAWDAVSIMLDGGFSSVPVLSGDVVIGIFTKEDALRRISAAEESEPDIFIQLSRKGPLGVDLEFDQESVIDKIQNTIVRRHRSLLASTTLTVYLNSEKRQRKGRPLVHVRLQINGPQLNTSVSAEGWGVNNALTNAISLAERILEKEKEARRAVKVNVEDILESII